MKVIHTDCVLDILLTAHDIERLCKDRNSRIEGIVEDSSLSIVSFYTSMAEVRNVSGCDTKSRITCEREEKKLVIYISDLYLLKDPAYNHKKLINGLYDGKI